MNVTPGDTGAVVHLERSLACPMETAWRALTEPAHLARWYPCPLEIDLRVGGRVRALAAYTKGWGRCLDSLEAVVGELRVP
jgi:uncharacterized protein YndB with AHSA1/START domain